MIRMIIPGRQFHFRVLLDHVNNPGTHPSGRTGNNRLYHGLFSLSFK
jgi:hypothetical protein